MDKHSDAALVEPVSWEDARGRAHAAEGEGPLESLLSGLNEQQRAAVTHAGSPLLVVAGAGSGKTRVLVHRIAYLLAQRDVHPGQIMAITFTNKAAAELKQRVTELVGRRANPMWVSTFHSMCVKVLRREAKTLGLSSNFSIYDADDSRRLVTMVMRELEVDSKRYQPRNILAQISNLKNELQDPEQAATLAGNDLERVAARVYAAYQQKLADSQALDFDDLIMRTVQLFRNFPDITEYYRRRFRHVLVDEYQDTNHAQYVLVRELVGGAAGKDQSGDTPDDSAAESPEGAPVVPPAELCVVGDADQSIYAFRGATIRNIEEFEQDFPQARTILLEQNYRSTQNILSAANAVIQRNAGRRAKRLWSDAGEGELLVGYVADNEHDEAAFVAEEIDRLVDAGEAQFRDIAVFYRTNNQSRVFEEVFIRLGLPYRVVGGVRFYERREIRDALAYLRVLDNLDDTVSMRRILNVPKRGIGDRAEAIVATYAEQERMSFGAALFHAAAGKIPGLATRSQRAIGDFVEMFEELQSLVPHSTVAEVLEAVLEKTGYKAELDNSDDPQDVSRVENLNELVTVAREFAQQPPIVQPDEFESESARADDTEDSADTDTSESAVEVDDSLAAFLERVSLVADTDSLPPSTGTPESDEEEDSGSNVVTLMTLHTAKGLEFPVVFSSGWEDGIFPHLRTLGDNAELAEERRLAYVGITRARQRLYVSRALVRSAWGQPSANPQSRFLAEIPTELVEWRRAEPEESQVNYGRGRSWDRDSGGWGQPWGSRGLDRTGGDSAQARLAERVTSRGRKHPGDDWRKQVAIKLEAGDRVNHDKYGLGTVIATEGEGPRATATIDFGSSGTVRLMLIGSIPLVKL